MEGPGDAGLWLQHGFSLVENPCAEGPQSLAGWLPAKAGHPQGAAGVAGVWLASLGGTLLSHGRKGLGGSPRHLRMRGLLVALCPSEPRARHAECWGAPAPALCSQSF